MGNGNVGLARATKGGRRGSRLALRPLAGGYICALLLAAASAAAEDGGATATFMGIPVSPLSGTYLVLKDANVRDTPRTDGRRLAGIDANERVQAVGQPEGAAWIGVRKDGADLGFVYAPLLLPLIDGRLASDITGAGEVPGGPTCLYTIRFTGKGAVSGEPFQTADYDVDWRCRVGGRTVSFYSLMFITEAPFAMSQSRIHQISLEFPHVAADIDRVLATILLYDRVGRQVRFDRVTMDELAARPATPELPAATVPEALLGAAAIAMSAWNDEAWARLASDRHGPADMVPEGEDALAEDGGEAAAVDEWPAAP